MTSEFNQLKEYYMMFMRDTKKLGWELSEYVEFSENEEDKKLFNELEAMNNHLENFLSFLEKVSK
jgi:hypothetical protein